MRISVVVPVHNGGEGFLRCLEAINASTRTPDEVIVVDDASSDASAEAARHLRAQVLSLPDGPRGPAAARNYGAAIASGDVLVFVDADVVVHHDTLSRIEQCLSEHPDVTALFGSYDDAPPYRGLVTLYKNLLHHYVHQHGRREASTFWAGCGAIRREAFLAMSGFDEAYSRPSIEDIELGTRLRKAGRRVWLRPDIQVTHLKDWNLSTLLKADILNRAVPWTRLILADAQLPSDLNLDYKSRLSALNVWVLLVLVVLGFWSPWLWLGVMLPIVVLATLNVDLYRFFARRGGLRFAAGAFALHALYFLYSSLVFGSMVVWHMPQKALKETRVETP